MSLSSIPEGNCFLAGVKAVYLRLTGRSVYATLAANWWYGDKGIVYIYSGSQMIT
jgi:hypothetical protein